MSNIIKPTVGRKVWYRPSKWDREGRGGMQVACDQSDTTKFQPLDAAIDRAIIATTPIGSPATNLQFTHQPTLETQSFGVAPAVKPGESLVGFSLDSDKPLAGGVCDMSAGCEACQ